MSETRDTLGKQGSCPLFPRPYYYWKK